MRITWYGGVVALVMATLTACGNGLGDCAEPVGAYVADAWPEGAGGTVMVARGGEVAYCQGFGMADVAGGVRAGCDTVYDVMSITKQFTAAAVLKLEMMGRLRVTDPIGRYLGAVPADKRPITLHQLLTHTSGLVEALGDDYDPLSRADMLAGALASELRSPPGAEFHYSNVGYSLLAAIIEKVSGLGYERFLATHLFEPAGMTRTGYVLPDWPESQVAVEYDGRGASKGRPYDHPWAPDGPYWNLRGNGGMLSTARDLLRWHRALSGDTVLSAAARRELFTPYVRMPDSDDSYGYGWVISDDGRIVSHDGGDTWSLADYARSPDGGVMVFWISNHAYQEDRWNMEDLDLTRALTCRARSATPGTASTPSAPSTPAAGASTEQ